MGSQLWPVTSPTLRTGCSGGISPSLTFQRLAMVRCYKYYWKKSHQGAHHVIILSKSLKIFCSVACNLSFFILSCFFQLLWTFWFLTVRSTTMPAVTFQQMGSCWPSSFPAANGVSPTRAIWPFTPSRPITWARCSTPRDSVGVKHTPYPSRLTLLLEWHFIFDVLLCFRSECYFSESFSYGLLRDGGIGFSKNPPPPHHWPHGGASVPPTAAARWRNIY